MTAPERSTLSLADYVSEYQWIRMLGWSEDELRSVPVFEQYIPDDDVINLANFGGTSLGIVAGPGSPTSADARSIPNLWIARRNTPPHLWSQLQELAESGGPSGHPPGDAVTKTNFPPAGRGSSG